MKLTVPSCFFFSAKLYNFLIIRHISNTIKCIDPLNGWYLLGNDYNTIIKSLVGNNHHFCIAMLKDVTILIIANGWIYRHMHHTNHRHAHINKVPLGAVIGGGYNFIAFLKAHGKQPQTEKLGCGAIFVYAKLNPAIITLSTEHITLISMIISQIIKDVESSP